jgi:hypothetical protein
MEVQRARLPKGGRAFLRLKIVIEKFPGHRARTTARKPVFLSAIPPMNAR